MFNSLVRLFTTIAPDFQVLWLGSKDLVSGGNPYLNAQLFTGIGYPPNSLLFYIPFTFFTYQTAQNIFTVISFISLFLIIYFTMRLKARKIDKSQLILFFLFSLLFFPTKFTLGMGQNNLIAFLILVFSYYLHKKDMKLLAGILLGLAITFKTIFIIFLLFFLLKKEWRIILYSLISTTLLIILTMLISPAGSGLYSYYFTKIIPPLLNFQGRENFYNQGVSAFISRLPFNVEDRRSIWYISSLLIILTTSYFSIKKAKEDFQFSLFVLTLLLVDSLSWQHHFVWSLFSFITLYPNFFLIIPFLLIGIDFHNSLNFLGLILLYLYNIRRIAK